MANRTTTALLTVVALILAGCSDPTPPAQAPATTAAPPAPATAPAPPASESGQVASKLPENAQLPSAHPELPGVTTIKTGREVIRYAQFRVGNRNVKSMLSDGDVVWVGTSGGVIRYDTKTDDYRLFDVRSGLLSNGIFHLSKRGDKLVVGTYGGGLSILDHQTEQWSNYNIQHGLADSFIYDVEELDNGDIWIATWSGANRIRGGNLDDLASWDTFTVKNTQGGLPNDWVYGLAKGANGELWLATEGGLARFQDEQWSNWKHDDGLGADYALVKDNIQFGRDPSKESSHHARQKVEMGLTDVDVAYNPNYIVALTVDHQGVVWAGTWGGGLARFDGTTWKNFTTDDGLPANHVFMLDTADNGRLWVGTSNGLARFDGERFTIFTIHDGLLANNIFSMAKGDDGSLWLGSFGGVTRLRNLEQVPD